MKNHSETIVATVMPKKQQRVIVYALKFSSRFLSWTLCDRRILLKYYCGGSVLRVKTMAELWFTMGPRYGTFNKFSRGKLEFYFESFRCLCRIKNYKTHYEKFSPQATPFIACDSDCTYKKAFQFIASEAFCWKNIYMLFEES